MMRTPDEPMLYLGPDGWAVGYPSHLGVRVTDSDSTLWQSGHWKPGGVIQTPDWTMGAGGHMVQRPAVRSLDLHRAQSRRCDCNGCAKARLAFLKGLRDPDVDWLLKRYHHEVSNGMDLRSQNVRLTESANLTWQQRQQGKPPGWRIAASMLAFVLSLVGFVAFDVVLFALGWSGLTHQPVPWGLTGWNLLGTFGGTMLGMALAVLLDPEGD